MNNNDECVTVSYREIIKQAPSSQAKLGPTMEVARVIPSPLIEAIGPFVFFDHVGPMPSPDQTIAPHPHAGIEVITYLIEGTNTHQDSMGNVGRVTSGGLQWITAGRGILHKERIVPDTETFHAVQLWTRLPKSLEDDMPRYKTVRPDEVPEQAIPQGWIRLLAGRLPRLFAEPAPLHLAQPTLLLHLRLEAGANYEMSLDIDDEIGLYSMRGCIDVAGKRLNSRNLALLGSGQLLQVQATSAGPVDILILGGQRAARPIVVYGSFVYDNEEAGARAMRAYHMGKMGTIDGVPF